MRPGPLGSFGTHGAAGRSTVDSTYSCFVCDSTFCAAVGDMKQHVPYLVVQTRVPLPRLLHSNTSRTSPPRYLNCRRGGLDDVIRWNVFCGGRTRTNEK